MQIYVRTEYLIAISAVSAALIIAFLWLLVWFVRHLTSFAQALKAHADVNTAQANELLANVTARREEREACDQARAAQTAAFEDERQQFKTDLAKLRADSELASAQLSAELVKMKGKQAQTQSQLDDLRRENERLQARVTTLEAEGKEKDRKITDLVLALDQSEQDKQQLSDEMITLRAAMNGKADKPAPEPGETVSPAPEVRSEETTHDGTD